MTTLAHLFDNNRAWSERVRKSNPNFFSQLANQQSPEYLWIGCSDSRVPANDIVGLLPGELFVHRNVANLVVHTDLNCLSVMQFAVDVLKVKHIIVCGHYGCSGIRTTWQRKRIGLSDNWLRHVQDVRQKHERRLNKLTDETQACDRLGELNVIEQVMNVCQTTIAIDAWDRGQDLMIHGWVYGIHDGLARDLKSTVGSADDAQKAYETALTNLEQS